MYALYNCFYNMQLFVNIIENVKSCSSSDAILVMQIVNWLN